MSGLLALRRRCAAGLSGYEYSVEEASTTGRTGSSMIAFRTMA